MRGAAVPCRQPPAGITPASLLVVPQQAYQHPLHRRHQPHWPPQQQRRGSASAVASQQQHQEQQWESLSDVVWEGSEEAALAADSPLAAEQPLWRLLLLSDGSVTRHLQLLTGTAVKVDCLAMAPVPEGADSGLPAAADALAHPLLQREVLLLNPSDSGRVLVHATSWWNTASASTNLRDPSRPIWVSLSEARKELYREIQTVQLRHSETLEVHFGCSGPFWGRQYLFWHAGTPLCLIHEAFSPQLARYLRRSERANGADWNIDAQLGC